MAENYGTLEGTLDEHGVLSGEMSDRATLDGEIQFSGGGGGVLDVFQNGQSVVEGRKAYVTVPTLLRELRSDDYHNTVTALEMQIWNGKADPSDIPENITDLSDVAVDNIQNGQVLKWDATQGKFVNANESGGGSGDVADVKVNGQSVVDPVTKEAEIDLTGYAETSDIPTDLADLSDDATHRLVTDTEKSTWDNKADVSDIPTVNNNTITIQKNGQNVDSFTLNQNSNKAINIAVPTKTSDLQNDSSFITNTVNNLANYYLKSQTYTQAEVDALIDAAVNGRFQKVNVLPATGEPNIIYLVPKATPETSNACDEYIWQDNDWELIGSTDIDLSGYVTDDELNTALADYLTTSAFNTAIANYYNKTEIGNLLDDKVDKVSGKGLSTYDYDATAKGIVDNVTTNLAGKVDKVNGKGLSTNDYDNTAKGIVDGVTSALAGKVDKVNGKGLSTEDYTTTEKNKLAGISTNANKVEASTTNGNIVIDDVETPVYRLKGNNTVLTTDKTPFLTRQTLNPTGFSGYVREKLVGASYAWNQQFNDTEFVNMTSGLTATLSSHKLTITGTTTAGSNYRFATNKTLYAGHKYAIFGIRKFTSSSADYGKIFVYNAQTSTLCTLSPDNQSAIFSVLTTAEYNIYLNVGTSGITINFEAYMQLVDLTLAFGSTIADYLYGLSNNGGITKLRDMGFPIDKYTPYGYGLYSVKTSGKKIVGKNLVERLIKGYNIASNGSIGADANYDLCIAKVIEGKQYAITSNSETYVYAFFTESPQTTSASYNNSRAVTSANSFTSPINGWVAFRKTTAMDTPQLEYGSTSTTYEPYCGYEISLGNDELRGKFDLVNGEIVASGDVKDSNGKITRNWKDVNLGDETWTRYSFSGTYAFYVTKSDMKSSNPKGIFAKYAMSSSGSVSSMEDKTVYLANQTIYIRDDSYTDATTFKTSLSGLYGIYELATPTTEQSTPFADPMSMVGATTEEYIDTRDIPCPVGAERQYMGESDDVIPIPSSPMSDGERYLKSIVSGGKEQYVWDSEKIIRKELYYNFGNVVSGTRYSFAITDNYPEINKNTLASISISFIQGASVFDYEGKVGWNFGSSYPDKIYINYISAYTQNSAYVKAIVTYYIS